MLVGDDRDITVDGFDHSLEVDGVTMVWSGLLYVPGRESGRETAQYVLEELRGSGRVPFSALRGSFKVLISMPDKVLAFADNSDLSTLYVHARAASGSFVDLVKWLAGQSIALELNLDSVASTYSIGRVLSSETILHGISMLDKDEYVEVSGGRVVTKHKQLPDIDQAPENFVVGEFFDALALAVGRTSVSCALTGGYDSRMVYAFLCSRLPVVATLSGDLPDRGEAVVAARAALSAGTELSFVSTPRPAMNEGLLRELFTTFDAAPAFASDASLRLWDYYGKLRENGIATHVTGDGGVLHKDWEWIQDFPFYHRRRTNLNRFFDHRLGFNFDDRWAGPAISGRLETFKQDTVKDLRRHVMRTNTQSYDKLYYHVNGRRTVHYNPSPHGLGLYAPLLERELVAYSYALPRFQRFFNNNIRKLTTAEHADLARVPTVYGMTASSEPRYVARDIWHQIVDYSRRGIRLVGRRLLGRTPMLEPVVSWSTDGEIRELAIAQVALNFSRSLGIVAQDATIEGLSRQQLDAVLQVFFIGELVGAPVEAAGGDARSDRDEC